MRIRDASEVNYLPATETREARKGKEPDDRVSISGGPELTPTDVEAARAAAARDRAARVSELAAAIKSGIYRPDPERIAQQILDDAELTARLRAMLA